MYNTAKGKLEERIVQTNNYALTTDTWTSLTGDNYMTVTLHMLIDWELSSYVLSTTCSNERHTAENLQIQLKDTIINWKLPNAEDAHFVVTTDNAANIKLAVTTSELDLKHVGCFAHTLNLAVQKSLKTRAVDHILGHVKRIVSYFHRSSVAKGKLNEKQVQLQKKVHTLINEVSTRWNSSLAMLERFAEQRTAVYAALDDLKCNDLLLGLSRVNAPDIELIISFLQPFKIATDIISGEAYCTISLIKPLLINLIAKCEPEASDPKIIADMKAAVLQDLGNRYSDPMTSSQLTISSLLDPRFKKLTNLSKRQVDEFYETISVEAARFSSTPVDAAAPRVSSSTAENAE